jgi:hypothetical protein
MYLMGYQRWGWMLLIGAGVVAAFGLPTESYQAVAVDNSGVLEGRVTYQGAVPTRKIIPTKDQEVCGGIREEPQIIVGPDHGVQDAVVHLKKLEKGKAWPKLEQTPKLINKDCTFVPRVQVIPVGGEVDVVNADPVLHNTHSFLGRLTVFNLALPNQGQRIKRPLNRPGMVRVECDAHGWMLAWIYVADNPYYAVSGKDGTYIIGDVPPGEYALVAWHEFTGETEVPVTVKAKEAVKLTVELKKK